MNTRCSVPLSVSTGHVQRMGGPSFPCSIPGITCPQGTGFTMPKVSLFPLGIPCTRHWWPASPCLWYLSFHLALTISQQSNSSGKQGYNHPCTPLDGAVRAAGNPEGCKLTASGTNLRASSCPTLPVPCQSSLPDAGKQVHLWSSSVAGCYFSVPGRAWPCPALASGVVVAM